MWRLGVHERRHLGEGPVHERALPETQAATGDARGTEAGGDARERARMGDHVGGIPVDALTRDELDRLILAKRRLAARYLGFTVEQAERLTYTRWLVETRRLEDD